VVRVRRRTSSAALAAAAGVVLAAIAASAGGCGEGDAGSALKGSWHLQQYARAGALRGVLPAVPVSATFDGATVAGNASVNHYGGPFTADGKTIRIGPLAVTRMAGPQPSMAQEAAFLADLGRATSFAVEGGVLKLFDEAGGVLLVFARASE
jgi:heat shock protein HslJ